MNRHFDEFIFYSSHWINSSHFVKCYDTGNSLWYSVAKLKFLNDTEVWLKKYFFALNGTFVVKKKHTYLWYNFSPTIYFVCVNFILFRVDSDWTKDLLRNIIVGILFTIRFLPEGSRRRNIGCLSYHHELTSCNPTN